MNKLFASLPADCRWSEQVVVPFGFVYFDQTLKAGGDGAQHFAVGSPVVTVHLADIAAVSYLGGVGVWLPADVGCCRIGGTDQTGEVEDAFACRTVFAETESALAEFHLPPCKYSFLGP